MTQAEMYSKQFSELMRMAAYYSYRATRNYNNGNVFMAHHYAAKEKHCYVLANQCANAWYFSHPINVAQGAQ